MNGFGGVLVDLKSHFGSEGDACVCHKCPGPPGILPALAAVIMKRKAFLSITLLESQKLYYRRAFSNCWIVTKKLTVFVDRLCPVEPTKLDFVIPVPVPVAVPVPVHFPTLLFALHTVETPAARPSYVY
jgi:hypothetical protein